MKLKKKTLFECSIAIPAIENDKEGLLVGGFSAHPINPVRWLP